ncbi:MAG: hypothetical protein FWC87_01075 [Acidimicrobiaceae bacterium]|nr:hypothetical protein [Acidimicrobiaceae bacterium]
MSWVDTLAQRKARAAEPQEHARPLPGSIAPARAARAPELDRNQVANMVHEEVAQAMAPVEDLLRQVLRVAGAGQAAPEAAGAAETPEVEDHPHRSRSGRRAAEEPPAEPA